jgi:hypothetical protein
MTNATRVSAAFALATAKPPKKSTESKASMRLR